MAKITFRAFLAIIMTIVVVPGAFAQKTLEKIAARVNNEIILESDVEAQKKAIRDELAQSGLQGAQLEQAYQARAKDILRDLIDVSLLLQRAKDLGMSADLEVIKTEETLRQQQNKERPKDQQLATIDDLEKAISQQMSLEDFKQKIRTDYLKSQVLNEEVYRKVIVTTEDQKKYYEDHKQEFDRPAGVRIREITVNIEGLAPAEVEGQRKKIEEALAAIRKGADFGEIAQKYSESQTAQNGGDLGFIEKGQLVKEIEDVISKLDKGQVSDIIKTQYDFMIFQLQEKHAGGILSFESAQNDVYNKMFNDMALPKVREYLNKLRAEGYVDVRSGYVDTGAVPNN